MVVKIRPFGELPNGPAIKLVTIVNTSGFSFSVMNYGASITEIIAPSSNGAFDNIVLGFDTLDEYVHNNHCFGAVCGRYAGRIKKGKFRIEGVPYFLPINDGENTLHGGNAGFDKQVWLETVGDNFVEMTYISSDGEAGFPGELFVKVRYTLTELNEIIIDYNAICNKPTVLNLTNHSYFNLSGCDVDVLSHKLKIFSSSYTPCDDAFIPTGEIAPLFRAIDFSHSKFLGDGIADVNGYNHNFILEGNAVKPQLAAELICQDTGRKMSVYTTEPALMIYTANYLSLIKGKEGKNYNKYYGICLEAQHFPDSPNHPNFPTTTLMPRSVYFQRTIYKFETL